MYDVMGNIKDLCLLYVELFNMLIGCEMNCYGSIKHFIFNHSYSN